MAPGTATDFFKLKLAGFQELAVLGVQRHRLPVQPHLKDHRAVSITKPGVTLLKIFLQALISLIRQRLLCTQHTRRHRAIAEQSGPVLFGRCRQRYCLAGIGDGIQPHQSVQRQRAHMPDILLAQYIRGAIRECDLIDRLPATVKLRHHATGIDGQQFSHFAKCFHYCRHKSCPAGTDR